MMSTFSPSMLVMAGALPLKGTCVTRKPIARLAPSPARWVMLPLLADPIVKPVPALALRAISPGTSVTPRPLRVTSSKGDLPMPATGTKSFSGS
jgi:hypothetical protein